MKIAAHSAHDMSSWYKWFYLFHVLEWKCLCCWNLMYVFIVLAKFG